MEGQTDKKSRDIAIDRAMSRGVSFKVPEGADKETGQSKRTAAKSLGKKRGVIRMATTAQYGIPSKFFESREEIRTWGIEDRDLVDPSLQPIPTAFPRPEPFHVVLPGYTEAQARGVFDTRPSPEEAQRDRALGPDLSYKAIPTVIPKCRMHPKFEPQSVGYDWNNQESYQMDRVPYVHAIFDPVDPEVTNMYAQSLPWTAYAYGVPRV
eukprot:GHVQ01013853.1.p1 GENE.GHVQ01013853.1~~GHVQ01013853.1.p1  ORF type:complete len:209 (+),score=23.18 GHVQ01013853.1:519-1145(+)